MCVEYQPNAGEVYNLLTKVLQQQQHVNALFFTVIFNFMTADYT